jgi:hypothetical protein
MHVQQPQQMHKWQSKQRPWFPTATNHEFWWYWRGGHQQALHSPTPYKHWENWKYCHTHSNDVDNTHTSATCGKTGPTHNPNASCANIKGRIGRQNAQDHLALGLQLHSTQLTPPAAAAPAATFTHRLLPTWRHGLAVTNSPRAVWWNATGQQYLPCWFISLAKE